MRWKRRSQVLFDPLDPAARDFLINHVTRRYPRSRDSSITGVPDRVEVLVRVRPVGLEILEDLNRSGHLAREFVDAAPTFDIIPNRHLAEHPELSNLAAVTFEWSPSVKDSGRFQTRILRDEAGHLAFHRDRFQVIRADYSTVRR